MLLITLGLYEVDLLVQIKNLSDIVSLAEEEP